MKYSVLIFGEDNLERIKRIVDLFISNEECKQIVLSCSPDRLLELASSPFPKTVFVKSSHKPYVALLNGLKAITEENVVVIGKENEVTSEKLKRTIDALKEYPAIYYDESLQAFDTRLVMFCLQMAIEINLAIDSYSKAVEMLAQTPLNNIGSAQSPSSTK